MYMYILWHVDLLLGKEHKTTNYTTEHRNNGRDVFYADHANVLYS
jgi:hypothetical protein